jgi:phosphoribosylglycinamide formyltransferase-1
MKNIAIFASGSGTNAQNIIEFFDKKEYAKVKIIVTDIENAFVLERASILKISSKYIPRKVFKENGIEILNLMRENEIDLIVLAGFLYMIPECLTRAFHKKIINIHPALLPSYGGKGMYGMNVHNAVKLNNEKFSGITIHYVNEKYDDGEIIFQEKCEIESNDTPENIAEKVHKLEYKYYPLIIDNLMNEM